MTTEFAQTDWCTVGEAARTLELSVAWVRQLSDRGTLVCTVTPLGRLISLDSVTKYAKERNA